MVSGWDPLEARCAFQYVFVSGFVVMICPMITVFDFQYHILSLFLAVGSRVMISMLIELCSRSSWSKGSVLNSDIVLYQVVCL